MAKLIATLKAVITRLIFGAHGFIAIWQVTQFKRNPFYWYLSCPILLLFFEGVFTLTIKENQEWKWFCPSVFLYLGSVVPAIWLLELDKVDRRLRAKEETFNFSAAAGADLKELDKLLGVQIRLPEISLSTETWVTLIEQFLMLTLIVGRWMLPKGDLTRDQLSQLLLVYIGTAADIIEFFDSFKDDTIAGEPLLVLLTLSIWSWSLMQFTVVLSATRARKPRGGGTGKVARRSTNCCCSIDVWGIALNITLQDAPFLAFRLLIILHYRIISYMNVFFTCKNTLVILLQLYRLYVVHSESRRKGKPKPSSSKDKKRSRENRGRDFELTDISIISGKAVLDEPRKKHRVKERAEESNSETEFYEECEVKREKKLRRMASTRKDTGYSTASSQTTRSGDEKIRVNRANQTKKNMRISKPLESKPSRDSLKSCKSSKSFETESRKNRSKMYKKEQEIDITEESDSGSDSDCEKSDKGKKHIEKLSKVHPKSKGNREKAKFQQKRLEIVYSSGDSSD